MSWLHQRVFPGIIALWAVAVPVTAQSTFDIYWVDVEGGAAPLAVAPDGQSMLIDTGFPGPDDRDAMRIKAALDEAGLSRIDHLVITHYHTDHVGGLEALAEMVPIGHCYDHNTITESENQRWVDAYLRVCGDKRTEVHAGDRIPFGAVTVAVVASNGDLIDTPINGGTANPRCVTAERKEQASPENQRSVGVLFSYGRFTFLDLGDFNWAKEIELACPVNLVGEVTLYQTSRHAAFDDAGAPTHLYAIKPQVVVVNNGPRKGLGGTSPGFDEVMTRHYRRIVASPDLEDGWQGHRSLFAPGAVDNAAAERIANFEESDTCEGHWLRASVTAGGDFEMFNSRNGHGRDYTAR